MRSDAATSWYVRILVIADALLLGASFIGAALLRGTVELLPTQPTFEADRYAAVAAALIPGLLGIFWLRGAYDRHHLLAGPEEYVRVLSACTYGVVLVVAASYVYGSLPLVSRGWLLFFWLLAIGLVGAGRFGLRRVAQALRRRGYFIRRVLIAGANDQGLAIAHQLHSRVGQGVEVVGFVDDYVADGTRLARNARVDGGAIGQQFPVLGHPRDTELVAREMHADLFIVVPAALSWESQQSLVHLADSASGLLEVRVAPTHYDLSAGQVQPAPLGFVPLVRVHPTRLVGVDALLQRVVDTGIAALILIATLPVLAAVLGLGWLRRVQPLFMRQRVLGQGGLPCTLCLLNPRVCDRLMLRGLPALVAVVRGELALVGPRPVPLDEAAAYRRWASLLLSVKPGLTGPWRLAPAGAAEEERVLADIWWIRNWSIWQHLFVLGQSLRGVWRGARGQRPMHRWRADRRPSQPAAPAELEALPVRARL
jgi:lipopolysaccharide/colanic/teichoic acid biosynthesis glycosyltransferase